MSDPIVLEAPQNARVVTVKTELDFSIDTALAKRVEVLGYYSDRGYAIVSSIHAGNGDGTLYGSIIIDTLQRFQ